MNNDEEKIDWHPGFVNAIKLEFFENEKDLVYESEKLLNQQPLRIDLLVVKKNATVRIKNEIGENFLGHNIIEFKSEDDELNIDTLYKVLAYACLYKSYSASVDEIKANDITTTLLRKRKPLKLFSYFKDNKIEVTEIHKGIYQVDFFDFPVQIVVTKELEEENHIWVSSIARDLSENQLRAVILKAKDLQSKAEKQYVSSILSVVSRLNVENIEKLKGDSTMEDVLFEVLRPRIAREIQENSGMGNVIYDMLKPRIDKEIQQGFSQGISQGILKNLIELVREKLLTLEVAAAKANMSEEEFKKLLAQSS